MITTLLKTGLMLMGFISLIIGGMEKNIWIIIVGILSFFMLAIFMLMDGDFNFKEIKGGKE